MPAIREKARIECNRQREIFRPLGTSFEDLLSSPTKELDWQRFFSAHPYVLSMALPVRIESADIVPLGRPGQSEPDFIFYPKHTVPVPTYGVIEIKRPTSQIVTIPRKDLAILTRDAATAIQQATDYCDRIDSYAPILSNSCPLFLGNRRHIFVVMGTGREISNSLATEVLREMIEKQIKLLSPNLQLIPYDTLLATFESALPVQAYFLVPDSAAIAPQVHRTLDPKKLYVGGLPYSTTEDEIQGAFSQAGAVLSVELIMDKLTGRSRAFGFVEMTTDEDAQRAIEMWNGRDFGGRTLTVNEAKPLEPRPPRADSRVR